VQLRLLMAHDLLGISLWRISLLTLKIAGMFLFGIFQVIFNSAY
jgi:hypothetical protein